MLDIKSTKMRLDGSPDLKKHQSLHLLDKPFIETKSSLENLLVWNNEIGKYAQTTSAFKDQGYPDMKQFSKSKY